MDEAQLAHRVEAVSEAVVFNALWGLTLAAQAVSRTHRRAADRLAHRLRAREGLSDTNERLQPFGLRFFFFIEDGCLGLRPLAGRSPCGRGAADGPSMRGVQGRLGGRSVRSALASGAPSSPCFLKGRGPA